jgi:hypothetical protein
MSQDRHWTYDVTMWGFHVTIVAVETQRCVFVFPHKLINYKIFGKKFIEHKMYVLIFSTILSEIFKILVIIRRDTIINLRMSSCNVSVILIRFQSYLKFFKIISANSQISNFMNIRPVRAELFHVQGEAWQNYKLLLVSLRVHLNLGTLWESAFSQRGIQR